MLRQSIEFKVTKHNKTISSAGTSFIMQPKPKYDGTPMKWFDDSKLIKGGK